MRLIVIFSLLLNVKNLAIPLFSRSIISQVNKMLSARFREKLTWYLLPIKLAGSIKGIPKGTIVRSKGNGGGLAHCHFN